MNGTSLKKFALTGLVTSMLSLASVGDAAADTWTRIFGTATNDFGSDIITDASGNLYYTGGQDSVLVGGWDTTSAYDMVVRKTSTTGYEVWRDVIVSPDRTHAGGISIGKDANGYVYAFGSTNAPITGSSYNLVPSYLLAKYNASGGARSWLKQFTVSSGGVLNDMAVDSSGNSTFVGYKIVGTSSTGAPIYNPLLVRYNSSGTKVYEKVISSTYSDQAFAVTVDSAKNIYIALTTSNTTGSGYDPFDMKVIKTDVNGTVLWSKEFDIPSGELPKDIVYNSVANSVLVAAYSYNKYSLLASLNPSTGAQNWLTNSASFAIVSKVAVKKNGEIFMTGSFGDNYVGPNNWGSDILLARFSSAGVLLETKYTGLVNSVDYGNGIAFDTNDNYFITGAVSCGSPPCTFNGVSMYGQDDAFILKNLP